MGRDKAFLEVDGAPLWRKQLRTLEQLQPAEIFVAGPSRPEWQAAGLTTVPDERENAGPLGGLVAALRLCSTDLLVALAIDLPRMTSDHLRESLQHCTNERGLVSAKAERFEPLAAIYPKASLALAEAALIAKNYSLQNFVARCLAEGLLLSRAVAASEQSLFLNMNTPADFAAIST